ncbi:hypothetical protein QBL02_13150 [Leucobacter sp. UT-8R-CII-1-4]|uniref:hypothetical protein n=1 Tax=Leucobacter sp. UT-8R-CII-1-4 TaxID=3040075 RepID=UPI0024A7CD50|nr:hypothetical protein [Leucobacter sp. UT-8R-CII-1-4]MDI6024488.1 hypothetical protein [Leucobacter sp. UT-8R-CII-1-4]
MLELIKEIPVTFGPHIADWWMVGVTATSAVASLVLGIAAICNGRRATSIAKRAAENDLAQRKLEMLQKSATSRRHFAHILESDAAKIIFALSTSSSLQEKDPPRHKDFASLQAEVNDANVKDLSDYIIARSYSLVKGVSGDYEPFRTILDLRRIIDAWAADPSTFTKTRADAKQDQIDFIGSLDNSSEVAKIFEELD